MMIVPLFLNFSFSFNSFCDSFNISGLLFASTILAAASTSAILAAEAASAILVLSCNAAIRSCDAK